MVLNECIHEACAWDGVLKRSVVVDVEINAMF
jgi:hypothetical protein